MFFICFCFFFAFRYTGIWDCLSKTVRIEGWTALYKGLGAALVSGAPYVGAQMALYSFGTTTTRRVLPEDPIVPFFVINMLVGAVSGVVAQTIFYAGEREVVRIAVIIRLLMTIFSTGDTVRRRQQTNGIGGEAKVYNSTWDCCRKIWVREGIRGFYGGCWANAVKAIPGAALQFAVFDYFRVVFQQ